MFLPQLFVTPYPNLYFVYLTPESITAQIIANFIKVRLEYKFSVVEIFRLIIPFLLSNKGLIGFKIKCTGRFQRRGRARYYLHRAGGVPLNTYNSIIDYSFESARLRYGACGIKI